MNSFIQTWDYLTRWWQVGYWFVIAVLYLIPSIFGADGWKESIFSFCVFFYALQWAQIVKKPGEQ
jgi:hypothetical protein